MAPTKPKKIRALVGLGKLPEGTIKDLLAASLKGLTENATVFPKPPIALADYQAAIDAYEAFIPAALDGSKTAVAHKNKLLHAAMRTPSGAEGPMAGALIWRGSAFVRTSPLLPFLYSSSAW